MAGSNLTAELTLKVRYGGGPAKRYERDLKAAKQAQEGLIKSAKGVRFPTGPGGRATGTGGASRALKSQVGSQVAFDKAISKQRAASFVRDEKARARGIKRSEEKAIRATKREEVARIRATERAAAADLRQKNRAQQKAQNNAARAFNQRMAKETRAKERAAKADRKRQGRTSGGNLFRGAQAAQVSAGAGRIARGTFDVLSVPIKDALEFGDTIAELTTLVDESKFSQDEMRKITREAGLEFGRSPISQAEALYSIISAGADNAADAQAQLNVANKLAIAGVTDQETAVLGISKAVANFGIESDEAGDVIFASMQKGQLKVGEFANAMPKVAANASVAGLTLQETGGTLAFLSKRMENVDTAATAMGATLSAFKKPGKQARKEAKRLGVDMSAAGVQAAGGLDQWLLKVKQADKFGPKSLARLFQNKQAIKGAEIMVDGLGEFTAALDDARDKSAGSLEIGFAKKSKTDAEKIKRTAAQVKDLSIEIGESLAPVVASLLEDIGPLAKDFAAWAKENPDTIKTIGLLTASVGGLAVAVKIGADAVVLVNGAISGLKIARDGAKFMKMLATETKAGNAIMKTANTRFGDLETKSGKAGAAVGLTAAAFAGWEIGQWMNKTFDADERLASLLQRATGLQRFLDRADNLNKRKGAKDLDTRIARTRQTLESNLRTARGDDEGFLATETGIGGALLADLLGTVTGEKEEARRQAERDLSELGRLEAQKRDLRLADLGESLGESRTSARRTLGTLDQRDKAAARDSADGPGPRGREGAPKGKIEVGVKVTDDRVAVSTRMREQEGAEFEIRGEAVTG